MNDYFGKVDIFQAERTILDYKHQVQDYMKKDEDQQIEISKLTKQIELLNMNIKELEGHIRDLDKRNIDNDRELNYRLNELNSVNNKIKDMQDIVNMSETQSSKISFYEKKIQKMEEQIEKSQTEITTEKIKSDNLQAKLLDQIKNQQNQIQDLMQKIYTEQSNYEQIKKNVEIMKQQNDKVLKDNKQMKIEIEEKVAMINKQNEFNETHEDEKKSLNQKMEEMGNKIEQQHREIEHLKIELYSQQSIEKSKASLEYTPQKLDQELLNVSSRRNSNGYHSGINGLGLNLSNSGSKSKAQQYFNHRQIDYEGFIDSPQSNRSTGVTFQLHAELLSLNNNQSEQLKEKEETIQLYKNKLTQQSQTIQEQVFQINKLKVALKDAQESQNYKIPQSMLDLSREYRKILTQHRDKEEKVKTLEEDLLKQAQNYQEELNLYSKEWQFQTEMFKNDLQQKEEEIKLLTTVIYDLRVEYLNRQSNSKIKTFLKRIQLDPVQDTISTEISTQSSSH